MTVPPVKLKQLRCKYLFPRVFRVLLVDIAGDSSLNDHPQQQAARQAPQQKRDTHSLKSSLLADPPRSSITRGRSRHQPWHTHEAKRNQIIETGNSLKFVVFGIIVLEFLGAFSYFDGRPQTSKLEPENTSKPTQTNQDQSVKLKELTQANWSRPQGPAKKSKKWIYGIKVTRSSQNIKRLYVRGKLQIWHCSQRS